ncbi:KAP family P-loop NTPase fold protein [Pantoea ananatis]|uniref:KAP family P-loop NTPase fold protein n=1 Tax=Pantoea ananas TaxID=553 RepID=UPI000E285072|nr:P-loop NTPase fold protein [Pantoea ananatis]REE67500.1 KAP-like P-loop domain-containing protein [Pantoea ananatis]
MKKIPNELTFNWSVPVDGLPADSMDRSGHARFLTTLLLSKSEQGSYVLNLNAEWGAGKTWFLRRWQREIMNFYPTVYIDAWKNDHLQDPLLNVVAEIRSSLIVKTDKAVLDSRLIKSTWRLFKAIAPEMTKFLLKSRLGIDSEELRSLMSGDESADLGARLVEEALKAHESTGNSVEEFRTGIKGWLDAVINTSQPALSYPLFVFVDELDRCRPTYAIEMLETIKHLFSIANVVFVIATDKAQLQHSIRAIYGDGFNSRLYLDRFFQRSVTLNEVSRSHFIRTWYSRNPLLQEYFAKEPYAMLYEGDEREDILLQLLAGIADGFKMQLRTVDLWLDRLAVAIAATQKRPDIPLLALLMAVETHAPERLEDLKAGKSVFAGARGPDANALMFRHYTLQLHWHFGQYADIYNVDVEAYKTRLGAVFVSKIGLVKYLEMITAMLNNAGADARQTAVKYLTKSFGDYRQGRSPSSSSINGDLAGNTHHQEAFQILVLRHLETGMTKSDYHALCSLATHLD